MFIIPAILVVVAFILYFVPSIVALLRNHQNAAAILVLNSLLGWSFIGWVIALVWSFTAVESGRDTGTRNVLAIILGIVGVLSLIVILFVGGIAWFTFHTINNSEAANTARTYLRNNEVLKRDIGEVKDFSSFVTGQINVANGDGEATLYLKVYGEKRTVNATVNLSYRSNRNWRVTGASYDRDGQTIDLMKVYEQSPSSPPP